MKISKFMSLSELAEAMGDYVEPAQAAAMRNLLVSCHHGEITGDIPEEEFFRLATIAAENPQPFPDGLTCESARDAVRGNQPCTDMAIRELRRILDEVVDWGTPAAEDLRDDCRRYLEELEA